MTGPGREELLYWLTRDFVYELYGTQAVKRDNGSFKNVDLLRDQERVVLEVRVPLTV